MTAKQRMLRGSALILALASASAGQAEQLEIWIRAFIPNDLPSTPGYALPVPGRPGETMIPGPGIPFATNGPLPLVGSCYNTNNRGFSTARSADSKASSGVTLKISGGSISTSTITPMVPVTTRQFNCETGAITCEKAAVLSNVNVTAPAMLGHRIKYRFDADAENACIPLVEWTPAAVVPSIKWHADILVSPREGLVTFRGTLAEFPAYEAYVSLDGGSPLTLLNESPPAGATVWSLVRDRTVEKSVAYYRLDGSWQSSDPAGRFRLACTGDRCEWTETSGARQLRRSVAVERLPDGAGYRLKRDNADPELLTFLGFSSAVQTEMMSRGPLPSYIDLWFDAGALKSHWNGILVIKDAQGRFQEMKQPGSTPPKSYEFRRL